ncbi:hypothetical protein, partial [Enterococcus faecalis]
ENTAAYGQVVEKQASTTIKNDLINFTTPVVDEVNLKIILNGDTAESTEKVLFSKEYLITLAKTTVTGSTAEQITSTSSIVGPTTIDSTSET